MLIYLAALPLALFDSCDWAAIPVTLVIAFLLLGIEVRQQLREDERGPGVRTETEPIARCSGSVTSRTGLVGAARAVAVSVSEEQKTALGLRTPKPRYRTQLDMDDDAACGPGSVRA
jgi:hypothetical protein